MNVVENPALFPGTVGARPRVAAGEDAARTDFKTFLTLLTAQLRNQDPMQPIDSTEFVAQLASFTTAEQLIGTNERLDALHASSLSAEIAALGGWIGKEVAATDGTFRAPGGPVTFGLPAVAGAERVSARILDTTGAEVATFDIDSPGQRDAFWNGRDARGTFVEGRDLRIVLDYTAGGSVITQKPATVFRQVVAIRGTSDGIALDLADGGTLGAGAIGQLRDPNAPRATLSP